MLEVISGDGCDERDPRYGRLESYDDQCKPVLRGDANNARA
jgi:hypothetical protein